MRILALVTDAFGGSGGIAHYNRDLMTVLASIEDVEEIIIVPRIAFKSRVSTPPKIRQKFAGRNRFFYALQVLFCLLADGPFDVIFCGHLHLMPLAWILAKLLRKPLWLQLYGLESWDKPNFIRGPNVFDAALVTVISRYTRSRFLSWSDIKPEKVKVLPNAVSDRFQPGPKSLQLQERYGTRNKKVLLTVGRLEKEEKYKGQDRVIGLLPRLAEQYSNIVYMIVGDGNDRSRLEAMVDERGISSSVIFVGAVSDEELPDIYRLADVFVMPSTHEGFGFVFLEAAASGLPVLGGNRDGSVDALRAGRDGLLVDPDNPEELLNGMKQLLENGKPNSDAAAVFSFSNFRNHVQRLVTHLP